MTSDFNYEENGFYVEDGVLVKFNPDEYEGYLDDLHVPEGVTEIGKEAFVIDPHDDYAGVKGLTRVTLPSTCTILRRCAFYSCQELREVKCLSKLDLLEIGVFSDCNNLEFCVGVPKSQDFIPDHLYDRGGIVHVRFPNHVKKIGFSAFYDDVNLIDLNLNNVEEIEASAFYHCSLSEGLNLPETLKVVGEEAFKWAWPPCIQIYGVDTEIADNAFEDVSSVETIYVKEGFKVPENLWGMQHPENVEIKKF